MNMTPQEEEEFYADPTNRQLSGTPRRRKRTLSDPVPVRFEPAELERIKRQAAQDDRSVSSWLRLAARHELQRSAG